MWHNGSLVPDEFGRPFRVSPGGVGRAVERPVLLAAGDGGVGEFTPRGARGREATAKGRASLNGTASPGREHGPALPRRTPGV